MNYKVSVIIPIFNVEKYIERCAQHLFEQDLQDIEYIFVDDCSPDNSIAKLEGLIIQYPERQPHIKILRHQVNRGLPSARNTGLSNATGEFVFHCDSDDWIEKNALSLLYNKAQMEHAEIVWCDWFLSFKDNERYMTQFTELDAGYISGVEAVKLLLGGRLKYNVWNKLVNRKLYTDFDIQFPDGYGMGEDMTMIKLFVVANKVSYLPKALYHYGQLNNEAFTKKTTSVHLEQIRYNVDNLEIFLREHYGQQLDNYIHFFKLNIKLPFLISSKKESYERWNKWYTESNAYIDMNPQFNNRTRFIQKAAISRQYWILRLYYVLVIRFVYGIIYK